MSKKKKNESRGFLRYAIFLLIILFIFLLFKKDNLRDWTKAVLTIKKQKAEIEQLTKENESLNKKINDLSLNKDSLETFARERYFFSEKGDDVYIIENER